MERLLPLTRISRRRRNIILACCAIGAGGYVSYRVYSSLSVTRKRLQLYRFFHSLSSLLESAAQGSDCVGVLWKDLHSFLLSDQDEVPQTLKQLFKVGQTKEFQTSVALLCKSVTQGVVRSLSENGTGVQDGSGYGSALFEELSSQKDRGRKIGKASSDLGYRESTDGRHPWKERRWRSSGETDNSQFRDAVEDDFNYSRRRGKLERSESASRIYDEGGYRPAREEDEGGRNSSWKVSRNYYKDQGSWFSVPMLETSVNSGKAKVRSLLERRGKMELKEEGLSERLVGKLFSPAGRGFASVVVASAARSLVLSVLEGMQEMKNHDSNYTLEKIWSSDGRRGEDDNEPERSGTKIDGVAETTVSKQASSRPSDTSQDGMIDFLCSGKGRSVIADCIETFVGTAVSIYLDKTRDINVYEDILTSVSNPAHRDSVKELLTSVCNGAVETLVRASHEVLSVGSSGPRQSEPESAQFGVGSSCDAELPAFSLGKSSCFNQLRRSDLKDVGECTQSGGSDHFTSDSPPPRTPDNHDTESLSLSGLKPVGIAFDHSPQSERKVPHIDLDKAESILLPSSSTLQINGKAVIFPTKSSEVSQGWIDGVSRTLALPSNRALVLDVAGTVTAEAVRSAIEVMVSKVSLSLRGKVENQPISERRSDPSKVFHVINKTGALAQATASKALVAMTMCLAICLHTLTGPSRLLHRP